MEKSEIQRENEFDRQNVSAKANDGPINSEVAIELSIKFESYSSMIGLFNLLDESLEEYRSREYNLQRSVQDLDFWTNLKAYGCLLTNQLSFTNFISIPEEKFLQNLDTGDILLFRTDTRNIIGSWITRAVTKSHFDHVCVILRFGDSAKDVYLFEAVGEKGVRLASWLNVRSELYNGGFFEKIVTRKLLLDMTGKKLADLDNFRRNSTGLSYGLSPGKLLFKQKSEPKFGESQNQYEVPPDR